MSIEQNISQILGELPAGVQLVVVAKSRDPGEILPAIRGGASIIGENYVQEAEPAQAVVGRGVSWHFIGHLQKNKVKKAVAIFDMIETVDDIDIAREIDRRCAQNGKIMPVLVEVNIAREKQKSGVLPEEAEKLIRELATLSSIRVMGLMTMGPNLPDPEGYRPLFTEMKKLFERIKSLNLPGVEMKYLSMGMSDSYKIAVEEGANIVRIGTRIFGEKVAE